MLKKHSQLFEGLFTASDLLVVSLAWIFSYWFRFSSGYLPIEKGIPPFSDYLRMLLFVWLIWGFVFRRFGLYKPMRATGRLREFWSVVKANAFSIVLLMAVTYLFREKSVPFSRLVFVIFLVSSTFCTISSRGIVRFLLRRLRAQGYNKRHILLVGSGALASRIARRLIYQPEFGFEMVGCLSRLGNVPPPRAMRRASLGGSSRVNAFASEMSSMEVDPILRSKIIGSYEDLPEVLVQSNIDQVIIALPMADHTMLKSVIASIGDSMVDVKIVPDVHEFIQLGSLIEEIDGIPVVSLASTPLMGINRAWKRSFDLVVGSLTFLFALPLMFLIAVLVKITSKGPIFFAQERVGLDGNTFNIYKFRTMKVDAEREGACFAVKNDPRTTSIGCFLRRFNLDELPQLVNVVRGHMSLVGPRPERPVFIEEFRRHFPKYMLRHKVQAGMTGWAQVHGWRGNTSIEKRIEHDLFYIEQWSLALDVKILFLTLINSFRDNNAY
jgi:Undecaprenyl-phosphate glucose phosphotransferase